LADSVGPGPLFAAAHWHETSFDMFHPSARSFASLGRREGDGKTFNCQTDWPRWVRSWTRRWHVHRHESPGHRCIEASTSLDDPSCHVEREEGRKRKRGEDEKDCWDKPLLGLCSPSPRSSRSSAAGGA